MTWRVVRSVLVSFFSQYCNRTTSFTATEPTGALLAYLFFANLPNSLTYRTLR